MWVALVLYINSWLSRTGHPVPFYLTRDNANLTHFFPGRFVGSQAVLRTWPVGRCSDVWAHGCGDYVGVGIGGGWGLGCLGLQTALVSRLPWLECGWPCSEFLPTRSSLQNSQLIYFYLHYLCTIPQIFKFMDELGSSLLNIDCHCPVLHPPRPEKTLESFFQVKQQRLFFCHLFHL